MTTTRKKVNYLNNKNILQEIQNSKMRYCWFNDDEDTMYDLIVHSLDELTDDKIEEAKANRKARLAVEAFDKAVKEWETEMKGAKPRQITFKEAQPMPEKEDVVIRLMTFEHVPLAPGRKNKPKSTADHHARCNFPPFKQYKWVDGAWKEVVRSHWEGGLDNGKFSVDHGRLSESLAKMFMMLCHRYSMRSNWRGYTYVDEMRSQALLQLSQIALQFDESKSQNPFAYYTAAVNNSFTRVLNMEKRNQGMRDDLLEQAGQMPSYTRQVEHEMALAQERERMYNMKRDYDVEDV
jgi:hypothetical protein